MIRAAQSAGSKQAPSKAASKPAPTKPAEDLIRELYANLKQKQKQTLVLPWDHGDKKNGQTRLRMYNRPLNKQRIADHYTKPQQELLKRILKSICGGEWAGGDVPRAVAVAPDPVLTPQTLGRLIPRSLFADAEVIVPDDQHP